MGDRVVVACTSREVGGMERLAVGITQSLRLRGHDAELVFAAGPGDAVVLDWAAGQGVPASAHPSVRSVLDAERNWTSVLELARFLRGRRATVVNFHYGGAHISMKDVLAARIAGMRKIVVELHLPVGWGHAGRRKRALTRLAAMFASSVVVHSQAVRAVVREAGVPASKITVVPPGIRAPEHAPSRLEARERMELSAGVFTVGCMARLIPHKGVDVLIRAMAEVDDCRSVLLVAGDGPERPRLEALAAELCPGRVWFLGSLTSDQSYFFGALDLFVLPSFHEGFGLVLIEAAMHGVPVIGSDIGGIQDAVRDGETGILVPPGDPRALAGAIENFRMSPELRARLAQAGLSRARAEFSDRRMGERMEQVLVRGSACANADSA